MKTTQKYTHALNKILVVVVGPGIRKSMMKLFLIVVAPHLRMLVLG